MRCAAVILALALLTSACGTSGPDDGSGSAADEAPASTGGAASSTAEAAATSTPPADQAPDGSTADRATSTTSAPATTAPDSADTAAPATSIDPACEVLEDSSADGETAWIVVNDGVMGGRSAGTVAVDGQTVVFSGEIVTDGGGFSLIRAGLRPGTLDGVDRIVVWARPDDREYLLTVTDAVPRRDPRTSFQAPIPFTDAGGLQQAEVRLDDLEPVVFGRPIEADPLDPALVVEVSIQLSDGRDGPFRLELDDLAICSPEAT